MKFLYMYDATTAALYQQTSNQSKETKDMIMPKTISSLCTPLYWSKWNMSKLAQINEIPLTLENDVDKEEEENKIWG